MIEKQETCWALAERVKQQASGEGSACDADRLASKLGSRRARTGSLVGPASKPSTGRAPPGSLAGPASKMQKRLLVRWLGQQREPASPQTPIDGPARRQASPTLLLCLGRLFLVCSLAPCLASPVYSCWSLASPCSSSCWAISFFCSALRFHGSHWSTS
jgi:hypothetical protein